MALPGTLWVITAYNRAVLDKTQFQIIFLYSSFARQIKVFEAFTLYNCSFIESGTFCIWISAYNWRLYDGDVIFNRR